jgi:LDH2 family malate/lactate/ureidoglycolate dehydrogenase
MAEIFAGALSGGVCARQRPVNPKGNCVFMQLVDPAAFYGKEEFAAEVDRLIGFLRDCPLASDADEISLPGDRSRRTLAARRESGVPVEDGAWSELVHLARQLKVATPSHRNDTPTRRSSEDPAVHSLACASG